MTLTVEPGIYFNDFLIEKSKESISSFIDYELLKLYRDEVGGVRIEDDLGIVENGFVNFTKCPRTVEEIEECMKNN